MKVSEYIAELTRLQAEYGDLEVWSMSQRSVFMAITPARKPTVQHCKDEMFIRV